MSILIKGMDMPKCCTDCFAFKSNASGYLFCKGKKVAFGKEDAEWLPKRTPNWCPLVEIPKHGRLIDADALLDKVDAYGLSYSKLKNAPTVLEAEGKDDG